MIVQSNALLLTIFKVGAYNNVQCCRRVARRAVTLYANSPCKWKFPIGIQCTINFDPNDQAQADAVMSEDAFLITDSNQDEETQREELLQCFMCVTAENVTDPYDPCFLAQTNTTAMSCPDLTYTSCYTADATTEIDGEVYYFMERGCSKDEVGVQTGIDDTGETEDGRIVGMDATYTGEFKKSYDFL